MKFLKYIDSNKYFEIEYKKEKEEKILNKIEKKLYKGLNIKNKIIVIIDEHVDIEEIHDKLINLCNKVITDSGLLYYDKCDLLRKLWIVKQYNPQWVGDDPCPLIYDMLSIQSQIWDKELKKDEK